MDRMGSRPSVAVCALIPPIALGALVLVIVIQSLAGASPLWREDAALNVPTAVAIGDEMGFVRLVREGADPNAPATVPGGLFEYYAVAITALEAAVNSGDPRVLDLMFTHGVRADNPAGRLAVCIAQRKAPQLLPALVMHGAPSSVDEGTCTEYYQRLRTPDPRLEE